MKTNNTSQLVIGQFVLPNTNAKKNENENISSLCPVSDIVNAVKLIQYILKFFLTVLFEPIE